MIYYHTDVFSQESLSGNGLTVVFSREDLETEVMQRIAQEFKQFETIFVKQTGDKRFRARIFTVDQELDFAGHPVLGAISAIHAELYPEQAQITVEFELNRKNLQAESVRQNGHYEACMNQGVPEYLGIVKEEWEQVFLHALNLTDKNLHKTLPMEVVSTGLPYLIVPLSSGLENAKIMTQDLEVQLAKVRAMFVYVFDVENMEGRTWDNLGKDEDVATGSAAGPTAAWLYKWNIFKQTEDVVINQGRFVGRPSKIRAFVDQTTGEIMVSGDVAIVAKGTLL